MATELATIAYGNITYYNLYPFIIIFTQLNVFSFSPLETVTENVVRLTNAAITEVPFENYCTARDKVQNYAQCESCKVRIILFTHLLLTKFFISIIIGNIIKKCYKKKFLSLCQFFQFLFKWDF